MSTTSPDPPVTPPLKPVTMGNGTTEAPRNLKESSSQAELKEEGMFSEVLTLCEAPDKIEVPASQPPLPAIKAPPATQVNPDGDEQDAEPNGTADGREESPRTPEPCSWDEFEARYDAAMAEAKAKEDTLLNDFYQLARFFGIWATAAPEHDNERALKRIRTRETYIQTAEESLDEKKRHHAQVVEAFKSALALLAGP